MPSKYFSNHYGNAVESNLIADLYNEAIYIQGFSAYYIPNSSDIKYDRIFGDDPLKSFSQAYMLDTYLIHDGNYGEDQDFFSKFGLEIRNHTKVQFTVKEFKKQTLNKFTKPREGDLIFIPFLRDTGELFEIKFVNSSKDLYTLARTAAFYYELSLEPFKYNHESIDTGIDAIDIIENNHEEKVILDVFNGLGNYIKGETVYQGTANSNIAYAEVHSWDSSNSIITVINVTGNFSNTSQLTLVGATSNATYQLFTTEDRPNLDNHYIAAEVSGFIDSSDLNPSGSLTYY
jgi:hypothetical protein